MDSTHLADRPCPAETIFPTRCHCNAQPNEGREMFDSQTCSLITITVMVQLLGLATVICYRLRGQGRFNHAGLICGILVMGIASLVCMPINPAAGIAQGVALVFVAATATLGIPKAESAF